LCLPEGYLGESPDLIHERKRTCGQEVIILPLFLVPVELVDAILLLTVSLESILVFPTSPSARRRMEQKSLLVLLRNVVEEVVCDGKLTVELVKTDSVVLQEQEPILPYCPFNICNQLLLLFLVTIQLGKVNGFQFGKVVRLLCSWWRDPTTYQLCTVDLAKCLPLWNRWLVSQ
jgi:hypothetical protein